jgi:exopolysaccharide biosynthesis polyprenyl glycosylphosphotransferase
MRWTVSGCTLAALDQQSGPKEWHVHPQGGPDTRQPARARPRPVRAVGTLIERGRRGHLADRTLLRYGVRPFLLLVDVAAWTLAVLLTGRVEGQDLILLVLALVLFGTAGLHRSRLTLSALDDLPALSFRAVAAGAATMSIGVATDMGPADPRPLVLGALLAVLVVALRALAYTAVRRTRARGWVTHPTLVLGAGRIGGQLARHLLEHPDYGLRPVGFLDEDPLLTPEERPVPLLGGTESLASVIVEFGVADVVVAYGSAPGSQMVEIIRTCDRLDVEIFFVPRLFELHHTSRDMDQVWGVPLVRLRRAPFRSVSWRLKRVFDVVVAAVSMLLLSPLLLALALAVRLEGGPGVLFRQERVGLDERPFELLKFRSLRPADESESASLWNISQDGRLGPVGRFIRSTSLDELPQLWNILRGDMTFVGPRPERPLFVRRFDEAFPRYTARHRVPAGLTGWAQIHGLRGDTSIEERARFDNYYIENWSLWLDVKILLRTVAAVLKRAGG